MTRPHAAAEPPLASGRDLVVRYGGRTVLDRVSIEVRRREVVSVIGPNGAGKTTAVRALLGLIKPNCGTCPVERAPGVVVGYVPAAHRAGSRFCRSPCAAFCPWRGVGSRADAAAVLDEVGHQGR